MLDQRQLVFLALLHSVLVTLHSLLVVFFVVLLLLFKTVAVTTAAVKSSATNISKYFFITHRLDI